MNIAYLLVALAFFYVVLVIRGMNLKVSSAIFGNLAVAVVLCLIAVTVYPYHEAFLHSKAIERLRLEHQAELDRIKALNSVFLNPEVTRDYLSERQKE